MKEWMSGLKLFSKNEMLKWPFFIVIIYSLNFYRFAHIKHGNSAYYHGNPGLLRESILLPDSTIFAPIAILSAASKNTKKRGPPPTVMNPTNPKNP